MPEENKKIRLAESRRTKKKEEVKKDDVKKVNKTENSPVIKEKEKVLKQAETEAVDKQSKQNKLKKKAYIYNVGKRKTAIATVRLYKKGDGKIEINSMEISKYFKEKILEDIASSPLDLVTQRKNVNVTVQVKGGGHRGQAEAVRNGIAKALLELNPNFRKPLKKAGFLSRDSRKKERKKPGLKSARRAPQWRKR